ncbi:MFS transporter [Brevibacterium sp. UCMA 11754]|uniref:MFS transporter n=1 Tax=Brevibacterium sp. UCMA 11754 TaxID=2749198 RepID=UPI001F18C463|nr:MFS transporter [Brevibacterium sp. UCMA 11754]MCF2572685.1 MFS transporter [Brevibacterium sp. UCMA 11754]
MSDDNVDTDESGAALPVAEGHWRELFSKDYAAASLVLAGGIAIYAMNMFITAALLPSTVADIGGEQYFAWVTTAFLVASVLTSMLVARVLATWGAARAYMLAFALFGLGSLGAALSPTMEVLIAARVMQGFGGGLLAGLGYSVIPNVLPRHLWTRATGLVSAMWGFGTLVGPAIGGLFAQTQAWRGAFWLLTIVPLVLGFASLRGLPRRASHRVEAGPLPWASLGLLVLASGAFSTASVTRIGWPTGIALSIGVVLVICFVIVDKATASPVLPHFTYRRGSPLKWIYLLLGILSSAAMVEIFLPKFGQELVGLSPLLAGMFGVTVSAGWSFVQLFSASVDDPRTRRRLMLIGPVLVTAGIAAFAATQHLDGSWVIWIWVGSLVLAGAGIGLAFPHLNVAAMSSSDDPVQGSKAAAGLGTAELIANTIASALAGVLVAVGGLGATGSATLGAGLAVLGAIGIVFAVMIVRRISLR